MQDISANFSSLIVSQDGGETCIGLHKKRAYLKILRGPCHLQQTLPKPVQTTRAKIACDLRLVPSHSSKVSSQSKDVKRCFFNSGSSHSCKVVLSVQRFQEIRTVQQNLKTKYFVLDFWVLVSGMKTHFVL